MNRFDLKKIMLFFALVLSLALLAGCTGGNESSSAESQSQNQSVTPPKEVKGFSVGYARVDVTPSAPVPLHGYGNTNFRISDGFLDEIYVTAIAVTDDDGNTIVFTTSDNCNSDKAVTKPVRERIEALTGIPGDHVILSATHTHSSVDITTYGSNENVINYLDDYRDKIVQCIMEALEDRSPAEMYWDVVDLTGYNFVRHYITDLGEIIGDNHNVGYKGTPVKHTSDPNSDMYVLKFARSEDQDILVCNWRAHPTKTGGAAKTDISSDYICPLRDLLEEKLDCKFAFFQGEAGNMNPSSRITSETPETNYYKYGEELVERILAQLEKNEMKKLATGPIKTIQHSYVGQTNHTTDGKLADAQRIQAYWTESNDRDNIWTMCKEVGIQSPYNASAIINRTRLGPTLEIEVHATQIGDLTIVHTPLENFDTNGNFVRENSTTGQLMFFGYSNEQNFYLPSQYAFEYECYESDTTKYAPGEGEKLAKKLVELLEGLR